MGRRASMLLVIVVLLLAAAGFGAIGAVYRSARTAVGELLTRRLQAAGTTAARLLADAHDADAALADVATANQLDGAYVVDDRLLVVADAHGRVGRRANLLRLDVERLKSAHQGRASVAWGYDVEGASFLGGYFPLNGTPARTLVLEAGTTFVAPSRRLQVALALAGIAVAARAARREREAFGQAERAGMASRMAAMVAHEVRNPLGIIRGAAELLRERATSDGDRELVDDVLGEVHRLNALTDEFLTLGRQSALQRSDVDIGALARDVCDAVALRYPNGRLTLAVSGDARAEADAAKLRQALLNLVLNAAQAVDGAGEVRVETSTADSVVRVRVSDDGVGVAPEILARLFEPFATGKATGTGLGLAVARKIAERHGGTLRHVPTGRGACFELLLPQRAETT
jgi:signal transduction histidine kinase